MMSIRAPPSKNRFSKIHHDFSIEEESLKESHNSGPRRSTTGLRNFLTSNESEDEAIRPTIVGFREDTMSN